MKKTAMNSTSKVLALVEAYPKTEDLLNAGTSRKLAKMLCEAVTEEVGIYQVNDVVSFKAKHNARHIYIDFKPLDNFGITFDFRSRSTAVDIYSDIDGCYLDVEILSNTNVLIHQIAKTFKQYLRNSVKREIKRASMISAINTNCFNF